MDWRRQLSFVRDRLWQLIVIAIAAGAIAYGVSGVLPRSYEAKTTLIVGQSLSAVNPDYNQLLASQRLSATYAQLATTRSVVEKAMAELGINRPVTEVLRHVSATAALDSTLLSITVSDQSPETAASLANAIAKNLIIAAPSPAGLEAEVKAFVLEDLKATQAEIEATQAEVARLLAIETRTSAEENLLNSLQSRLALLRSSFANLLTFASPGTANILSVVEPAAPPDEPVWPRPLLTAGIASVLAVLVATLLILGAVYVDDGLKNGDIVREVLDLPTLGSIPRMPGDRRRDEIYRLTMLVTPRSPAAEAFRSLRTNLEFASVDDPLKSILITSPSVGDGKTVTAANLAIAFAQAGRRVLLVDADLRKPGVQAIFNAQAGRGLSDLLRPTAGAWEKLVTPTEEANLLLLTTGTLPPNPTELLDTQRMRAVMAQLRSAHDMVIVDAPPLLPVADASILSKYVDGVVLVVDSRKTRRDAARRAGEALSRAGARVLGVVVNRLRGAEEELYAAY